MIDAPAQPRAAVSLLDVEPELAAHVPRGDLTLARAALRVPTIELRRGEAPVLEGPPGTLWLVLSGALLRTTVVGGRGNAMLLGGGDVLRWPLLSEPAADCVSFAVVQNGAMAALGDRFRAAVGRWPKLGQFVEERFAVQAHRYALHAAACTLPHVHDRILTTVWQIAERWGRVRPEGVYVELDVSHRALGEMVGARRPTVTLALHDLASAGVLERVAGGWLVRMPDDAAPGSPDARDGLPAVPAAA